MQLNNNNLTHLQVVANYFGVNGTFQLLPAFNTEHFTLKGGDKDHPEKTDKSDTPCKCMLMTRVTLMNNICGAVFVFTNECSSKQVDWECQL